MSASLHLVYRHPRFVLESGVVLHDIPQAYRLVGALNPQRSNLIVVLHALTGSTDAAGDWWRGLIGPGLALDTDRYAILAPNLLGSCYGSAGPATSGADFPAITIRDQAHFVRDLIHALGARRVELVTGGSLGGMVAMELAAAEPKLSASTLILGAPAAQTAHAIGWSHVQRQVLELGGPEGFALARQIAMLTYRTSYGLEARFSRRRTERTEFAIARWLDRHGERLVERFEVNSYRALLDAMDSHDVGRGRGGIAAALRAVRGRLIGVGIPGDLLYPAEAIAEWVRAGGGEYHEIDSPHGHDAFLLELPQVAALLREALRPAHAHTVHEEVA